MFAGLPPIEENHQIRPEIMEKHLAATGGRVVTRFPPEPNGYLHIGHAKAMFINFEYARLNHGYCYLRFDDTNPNKEKQEFIDSIIQDLHWLGHKEYKITYTSDYFDQLYNYAVTLIEKDKAYICELDSATMQEGRYKGIESPYRNRPIVDSLRLFEEMRAGSHKEGSMTLRLKGDMTSNNTTMRDLVAYRILFSPHPRTQNNWCIYPSYDYSHPLVDSLENITHSLCSIEFKTRNELYRWILETLEIYRPPQIEYSRLNISHMVLSKRKLITLVERGIVKGWDDPRMPTLQGLRRRGYTPAAINDFCSRVGINLGGSDYNLVKYQLLEECLRQDLENKAPRLLAVLNPLKCIIENLNSTLTVQATDFPNLPNSPVHPIKVGPSIYIDRDDFRTEDSKNYFRLAPNKIVRLKYLGLVQCVNYKPEELHLRLVENSSLKVRGTLNWVSDLDCISAKIRHYDHMFPQNLDEDDWLSRINTHSSETIMEAKIDSSILKYRSGDKVQFERIGYFCLDPDTQVSHPILNFTVKLREDKGKN